MKKYGRHYLRRCLSVLLAVVMVCAAAQTLVFAVDLSAEDITPGWEQRSARARYTTSGSLEITFPESTKSDADYYVDFYDLDGENREQTVNSSPVLLDASAQTLTNDVTQVSATLDRGTLAQINGLDFSHRISIALTAVKDNWRSEAIEALVGNSLDIPAAGAQPEENAQYAPMTRFERSDPGSYSGSEPDNLESGNGTPPSWQYNKSGEGAMDVNGVVAPYSSETYRYPGFDSSNAFRLYLNGRTTSQDDYERFDVMYSQDNSNFSGADELWVWVDTSDVEFEEFALQVRYMDRSGPVYIDTADQRYRDSDDFIKIYSEDIYSTVGYAARNMGESVPIYYQNEDGLWDTIYTNSNGYLNNFGHYRGFLRVPIEYLQNEDVSSQYKTLEDERPYSYEIRVWNNYFFGMGVRATFSAAEADDENNSISWTYRDAVDREHTVEFNRALVEQNIKNALGVGFSVIPVEDIASVGITWKGASEDSQNKSLYIDQIGFSGASLPEATNQRSTPVAAGLTSTVQDSVSALVAKYLPATVTVADTSVIEDLEAICTRLGVDQPEQLKAARQTLDIQLSGAVDLVEYLHRQLNQADGTVGDIGMLFEVYSSLTLGEINRLGLKDENKLITLYNQATLSEWYPGALGDMFYKPFNDFETGYTIGQTALNEYDDYVDGGPDYYRFAHSVNWSQTGGVDQNKGAWENKDNFVAYAWENYDNDTNGLGQRFGYGSSVIAQNGFDGSKAVSTDIYRDPLVDNTENYRISVTYQGEEAEDYTQLQGASFAGADYFTFYGDFTNVTNIRKAWVTVRTANGDAYSHDDGTSTQLSYEFFDLDHHDKGWQTLTSNDADDGCMSSELQGKRGFFRINLSTFGKMGSSDALNPADTIKQVKFFISGTIGTGKRLNDSFVVDMFGFAANSSQQWFEPLKNLAEPIQPPEADEGITTAAVQSLADALFQDATSIAGTDLKLFDYQADTYQAFLTAYNVLTLTEKKAVDAYIQGTYQFTVDQLQLFVKNYDAWGGVTGNLQKNAATENDLRATVETVFGQSTGLADGTPNQIDAILSVCDSYPDYYQYSVQTYWPNRNLHAVFPNYNPQNVVSPEAAMQLNGDQYTGTFDLSYVGAVSGANGMNFQLSSSTVTLYSEDNTPITVNAALQSGAAVANGSGQTQQVLFTIPESSVTHAGTYTGQITLSVDVLPDEGSQLGADASQYRQSIVITVTLQCEPTYTVVIPADISLDWKSESYDTSVAIQEGYFLPDGASVHVTAAAGERSLVASGEFAGAEIPYSLSGEGTNWEFTRGGALSAGVELRIVNPEVWNQIPLTRYADEITFNVEYTDSSVGN